MKCRKLEFQFGNYSLLICLLLVSCGESIFKRALANNGPVDPPEFTNFTDTDISPFEEADISQFYSEAENTQHIGNEHSSSETVSQKVDCGDECNKDLERKEDSSYSSEHNEEPIRISITTKEYDVDTAKYGKQNSSFLMKTIENCNSLPSTCMRDDIHGTEANKNATTPLTDDQHVQILLTSSNLMENSDKRKTNEKIEANKPFSDSTSSKSHTSRKENEQSSSFASINTTQNLIDQVHINHLQFDRPSTEILRRKDFDNPFLVHYLQQIIKHLTSFPSHNNLDSSPKDKINDTIPSSNTEEKVALFANDSNGIISLTNYNDKLLNSITDNPTHSPHEPKSDDRNNVHAIKGHNSTHLPSDTTKTITHAEVMVEEEARKAIKQPSQAHNHTTEKAKRENENIKGEYGALNPSTSIHRKSKYKQPTLPSIYTESAIEKLLGNNKPTISSHSTTRSTSTSNLFSTLDYYLPTKTSIKSHRPEQHRSSHTPAAPAQKHLTTHPPTQKHSTIHQQTQKRITTHSSTQKHLTTHPQTRNHVTTHPPTQKHVTTHPQTPKHVTTHSPTQKHETTRPQTSKHVTTHQSTKKYLTPHRPTHLHTVRIHKLSQRPAPQSSYNVFDLLSDGHSTHPKHTGHIPHLQMQSKKPLNKNYISTTTKHRKNILRKPSKRRSHEPSYPTAFHPPLKMIFPQKTTPVHPREAKITNSAAYPSVSFDTSQQKNSSMSDNNNIDNDDNSNAEIGIPAAYAGCNGFEVTSCFGGAPYFNDSTFTPTTEQYSKQQPVPVNGYAFASNNDHTNMAYAVHSDKKDPLNVTKKTISHGNYNLPFSTPTNSPNSQRLLMPKSASSRNVAKLPSIEGQPRTANPTLQMIQVTSSSINVEFPTVMLPPFHDASSSVLVQLPPVLLIPGSALPLQSELSSRKAKTTPLTTSAPLESHEISPLTTSSAKKINFPISLVKPLHSSVKSFPAIPTPSSNILIPMPLSPVLAKNSRSSPIAHASAQNFRPLPKAPVSVHNFPPQPNAHASLENARPSPNAHASVNNSRSSPNAHASAQRLPQKKINTVKLQHGKTKEFCSNSNPSAACFDSIANLNINKAPQNPANNQPKLSNIKAVAEGLNATRPGGKNPLSLHLPYPARSSKHIPVVHHSSLPKKNVTKAIRESKPICSPKNPSASCVHFYASKVNDDLLKNLLVQNETGVLWKSSVTTGKCVCRPTITKKPCACNCVKLGPFNVCKDPDVKDAFVYQHNS